MAEQAQIKFTFHLQGVDQKWLADIHAPLNAEGINTLPSITIKSETNGTFEVIREYRVRGAKEGVPMIAAGIIIDLAPKIDGEVIDVVVKSVIRRITHKNADDVPVRFEAIEHLIDLRLENNKPRALELDGGGKLIITAILIDHTGQPLKK